MPAVRLLKSSTLIASAAAGAFLVGGVVVAQQATPDAASSSPAATASDAAAPIASARALGDAFATVAEQVSPSVVSVRVEARIPEQHRRSHPFFGGPQNEQNDGIARGNGSGVVIRPDGYVLTNNHVVQHAQRIEVELQDGRVLPGRVVGIDPATDLAVLHVAATDLPTGTFADSRTVRPGQWAIAIGSPFGLDYSVTTGVVSSVGRGGLGMNEIEDYIQTDASINPGNSGGPLVDLDGRIIGINTMIIGRSSGIGFAVSAELAQRVAGQIIDHGRVRRPWIGVQFQELTPELASAFSVGDRGRAGALIADVVRGGPAERAGLQAGDVVVAVDGAPVGEGRDLLRAVLRRDVGERVRLDVVRATRRRTLVMTTAERPGAEREDRGAPQGEPVVDRNTPPTEGLTLSGLNREQRRQLGSSGVLVQGVQNGSDAARAGLRRGDVIVQADGAAVRDPSTVAQALTDGRALLRVRRGEGALYLVLSD